MDLGFKIILIIVGIFVVAGILWEITRHRWTQPKQRSARRFHDLEDGFDDMLLIRNEEKNFNPNENIIALNLLARKPNLFTGKQLLEVFRASSLFLGEWEIFHRYENTDGSGKIVFSVVSAVEPGVFVLSKMETFETPGITLFFTAERLNQSVFAFELMLRTARQLASELDADILDDKRHILNAGSIEKYRERVRNAAVKNKPLQASSR